MERFGCIAGMLCGVIRCWCYTRKLTTILWRGPPNVLLLSEAQWWFPPGLQCQNSPVAAQHSMAESPVQAWGDGGLLKAFYFFSPQHQVCICEGRTSSLFLRNPLGEKDGPGHAASASEAGSGAMPEQSPFAVVNRNLLFWH